MKKLFIGALALTMFTACSQDEIIEQQQLSSAITFDGAFVDNATRVAADPSTTTTGPNALTAFDVWAFMNETNGTVFVGEDVEKDSQKGWTYNNTQYWLPNNKYYFGALAPMNSNNWSVDTSKASAKGIGELTFSNVDGTEDLLYAAKAVETGATIDNDNPGKVKLEFNHLLSKVKFTFTNGFVNDNNYLQVENIKMFVPGKGSINLGNDEWWNDENAATWTLDKDVTTTLSFGHMAEGAKVGVGQTTECDFERFTIPASVEQDYIVEFDVTLYNGAQVAYTRTLSTTIENAQLRVGYAYNFKATLNHKNIAETELLPIVFDVEEVRDWVDDVEYSYNDGVITTKVASVSTAEQLVKAVDDDVPNIKLLEDIETNTSLNFGTVGNRSVNTVDCILDLNGKKITVKPIEGEVAINVYENASLTVIGEGEISTEKTLLYAVYGTLKVESGKHVASLEVVEVNGGGAIINGGEFVTSQTYDGHYWTLNKKDGTEAVISVTGGKFYKFNPLTGKTENPEEVFVAEGYGVEVEGDYYVVKALPALSINVAAGETLKLNSNAIVTGTAVVAGTLDGGEYTLFAEAEPTSNNGLIRPTGTATIKNLTLDGENKRAVGDKSLRAFYINADGTYAIDNVITKGTGYALNCGGEKAPTATLNVSNSTFEGWTSYSAGVTATFKTVKFTRGNYFGNSDQNGYFRPYGTTLLENCEFALGYIVDFGSLAEGKTITFKNCKYNGVALTAENIPAIWENYAAKQGSVEFQTSNEE